MELLPRECSCSKQADREAKRQRQTDKETDMIKVVVAVCNFAREPKMNPSRVNPFEFGYFAVYANALKGNKKFHGP